MHVAVKILLCVMCLEYTVQASQPHLIFLCLYNTSLSIKDSGVSKRGAQGAQVPLSALIQQPDR